MVESRVKTQGVIEMEQVVLDIAPKVLLGLRVPIEEAGQLVRLAAAVKLYE